jgi:hypothetical protein
VFNWARFGSPFDTGYGHLNLGGFLASRTERFGLFHPAYLPFNLTYMFFQGPHLVFDQELILLPQGMDFLGTSLTFASPFVFFALCAKWDRILIYSAWIAIGLSLLHMLFYYNNGWGQINTQRFTLDFLPILMLLVAQSVPNIDKKTRKLLYTLITYSIVLNIMVFFLLPVARRLLSILI